MEIQTHLIKKVADGSRFCTNCDKQILKGEMYHLEDPNTRSCARDFVIPALKFYTLLPETGQELVEIPPQQPATIMHFTCSMGMYTGTIIFE